MNIKRYIYIVLIFLVLVSLSAVSAADDGASDIISAEDDELILDEAIDDDVSSANDNYDDELILEGTADENQVPKDILGDDTSTYSELSNEIGPGGNIELQHKHYTYDSGSTIFITTENSVINGNGAVIDMDGSNIQAFFVTASGVTIKDLTIKNANYPDNGGAIYFFSNGNITNCNFTNNKATSDNSWGGAVYFQSAGEVTNCNFADNNASEGGAVYFQSAGEVTNCNFADNNASEGGAVYFQSAGEVTNCNFTNNKATSGNSLGGAVYFLSAGEVTNCNFADNKASRGGAVYFLDTGEVTNCNFVRNSASIGGGIYSMDWYTSADTCIFKTDSDKNNVNVVNFPPTLNVDDFTSVYGSGEKIAFDLKTNVSSLPVTNGNISISVYCNDDTWVGNYSCLSGEEWLVELPVGSYYALYKTEYAGFEEINRTITITLPDIQYYANVTPVTGNNLTVKFTAKSNIPENLFMDGKLLFILPNGEEISANYSEDGTWWAVYEFDDYGDYEVKASFPDLDNVIINNATISLRNIVPINVEDTSAPYGEVTIVVSVSEAINGQNITISANESSTNATVENGQAKATFADLPIGEYVITAEYAGDGRNSANSSTAKLTVNKLETKLTASAVTTTYNVAKNLVITLKDSQGKALSGVQVTVDLNGAKNYTTDKNGQVKVAVGKMVPNTYTAKIGFAGDDIYKASSATAKVTVKKATPKITAKAKTFKFEDKTKKYTVTLKDNKGNVLKNKKVTLKVNGKTYSAKTNSKGVATFKLNKLTKKGKFNAVITYAGDKYYKKVTKKVKVTVKAPAKKKSTWKTVAKNSKDKATVKKIQQALKNNGYYLTYKGHYLKIDGKYKGCTERSVKQFQKAKGLKVTGKVDEKTAKKLKLI